MKRKWWIGLAKLCAAIYLGILLVLMAIETFLVYPAPPREDGNWDALAFGVEEVALASEDGTKLHGWYLELPDARAQLLFCHGNGEHVGYLGDEIVGLAKRFGVSIMAFDYRGYGRSEGKPFERGVLQDSEAAQRWLAERANINPSEVVLYGRSLGGGVAVHLADKLGARALILDRTFHSMVDIGAGQYPWLPIRWVMRNRYPSIDRIQTYKGPLRQLHGTADSLVPIASARKLFDACPSEDKSFTEVPGMGHNSATPREFYQEVEWLLKSI